MIKIQRISLFFRVLFQVLFVVLPLLSIVGWINAPHSLHFLHHIFTFNVIPHHLPILHALSMSEKMLGFAIDLLPLLVALATLYFLICLFRLFESGEIFSLSNVRYIRNIGYAILVGQLLDPAHEILMGIALTLHNPPGHRLATVTFTQDNLGMLFAAGVIILISWIMAEGSKLNDDQRLTI